MTSGRAHLLIVEARFYDNIADDLVRGAVAVLERADMTIDRCAVPGVFEVPAAVRFAHRAMETGNAPRFAGIVALGCVIRGETDHYDHICRETSRALMDLAVAHEMPFGFGILTCETMEQARVRADPGRKNKGADAALACLRMIELKRTFGLAT
ncbi:MAG: 6,7-dimethyl-8-ribityllumazine synthase [Rhodospirillales bacterium]|nr:6,7-dimethyl-8-ribityllumazine synthase [Rhodospirillales bacterium]